YQQRRRQIIRDRGIALHDTAEEVEQAAAAERGPTGEDLRLARRQRRLTQTEMARLLGVSQSMVSQIETGQRPIPDDLRQIIADWLAGE
ncbi:MAG: helix-turn-helix transcriptional regulator, partial [Armatimonadetes bacterium]|nr:helix-turn-helix transcriptional regulator [Armatimonadota bacterium]